MVVFSGRGQPIVCWKLYANKFREHGIDVHLVQLPGNSLIIILLFFYTLI
jgi:hypothetical protein